MIDSDRSDGGQIDAGEGLDIDRTAIFTAEEQVGATCSLRVSMAISHLRKLSGGRESTTATSLGDMYIADPSATQIDITALHNLPLTSGSGVEYWFAYSEGDTLGLHLPNRNNIFIPLVRFDVSPDTEERCHMAIFVTGSPSDTDTMIISAQDEGSPVSYDEELGDFLLKADYLLRMRDLGPYAPFRDLAKAFEVDRIINLITHNTSGTDVAATEYLLSRAIELAADGRALESRSEITFPTEPKPISVAASYLLTAAYEHVSSGDESCSGDTSPKARWWTRLFSSGPRPSQVTAADKDRPPSLEISAKLSTYEPVTEWSEYKEILRLIISATGLLHCVAPGRSEPDFNPPSINASAKWLCDRLNISPPNGGAGRFDGLFSSVYGKDTTDALNSLSSLLSGLENPLDFSQSFHRPEKLARRYNKALACLQHEADKLRVNRLPSPQDFQELIDAIPNDHQHLLSRRSFDIYTTRWLFNMTIILAAVAIIRGIRKEHGYDQKAVLDFGEIRAPEDLRQALEALPAFVPNTKYTVIYH